MTRMGNNAKKPAHKSYNSANRSYKRKCANIQAEFDRLNKAHPNMYKLLSRTVSCRLGTEIKYQIIRKDRKYNDSDIKIRIDKPVKEENKKDKFNEEQINKYRRQRRMHRERDNYRKRMGLLKPGRKPL